MEPIVKDQGSAGPDDQNSPPAQDANADANAARDPSAPAGADVGSAPAGGEPEKPTGFDARPRINCEICGKSFTSDDPYLPEKCERGEDCPVGDVPPRINAADGRETAEEIVVRELTAERERQAQASQEAQARIERVRGLWPMPGDGRDHAGLVPVTVVGDGENMVVEVNGVEVPRGMACYVPQAVADALRAEGLLA